MEQDVPYLQFSLRVPSPATRLQQSHIPLCAQRWELAQAHQEMALMVSKWSSGCGLLWVVLDVPIYRYLIFALHLVTNCNFKAKVYILSSINTLLKLPWSWKGDNFIFLPNTHPSSGPREIWEAAPGLLPAGGTPVRFAMTQKPMWNPWLLLLPKAIREKTASVQPFLAKQLW